MPTKNSRLLQHVLEQSATRLPDKVALICGQERLAYQEIECKANALAHFLRSNGIERQDRVAILLDNSAESVISIFAALKADAIFVVLAPTMKSGKLAFILEDCQVRTLVTHVNKSCIVLDALCKSTSLVNVLWVGSGPDLPEKQVEHISFHSYDAAVNNGNFGNSPLVPANIDLDLAAIIYTSGTTGEPKGIMLTHLNMISAIDSIINYIENQESDIIFNALPLSFDYGLYQILMAFKCGGTVVLERSFAFPHQILTRMIDERITGFPGVPTMFALLLGLKDLDAYELSRLRYITSTGAALPPIHIERLRSLFPHTRIYSMYGLTECKRVSYLPPEQLDKRPTSVGIGMPNEELWIVDTEGRKVGPGVVGELVVRGSNVMRGYWGRPEETARVLRPGRYPGEVVLYTGDLFRMDDEGFLYFVGRTDDMIKSRGERISPKEIEDCLCALDGVAEAAVFDVPCKILGQQIVACVRCHEENMLTANAVLRHCKLHLEECMIPHVVKIFDCFEKTSTGKIDKLSLKNLNAA